MAVWENAVPSGYLDRPFAGVADAREVHTVDSSRDEVSQRADDCARRVVLHMCVLASLIHDDKTAHVVEELSIVEELRASERRDEVAKRTTANAVEVSVLIPQRWCHFS